jgi:regulator of PEP synthase PpsR (kinase-PPPase family)
MDNDNLPPIYIVSGGKGLAGDVMVHSTLIQFPENKIPVYTIPDIISIEKLNEVIDTAASTKGLIVHTMVDTDMRIILKAQCKAKNVKEIDMMGELSDYVTQLLGKEPIRIPGLYRKVNQQYFDRISSIEFTLAHDDGLKPEKLNKADIILTGVSRAGKTPLSVYMAMFGWKVANVPLVKGIDPPETLFEVDSGRVFGLTINMNNLINQRNKRMERMGDNIPGYVEPREVRDEIDYAEWIFRKGGFTVIDVTNKPVESTANEIIRFISERYPHETQKREPI